MWKDSLTNVSPCNMVLQEDCEKCLGLGGLSCFGCYVESRYHLPWNWKLGGCLSGDHQKAVCASQ